MGHREQSEHGSSGVVAHRGQVAQLHAQALAQLPQLGAHLTLEAFTEAVDRSVEHRFRDTRPTPAVVNAFVEALHATDLALARACELGSEPAWEHVMLTYRPALYRAARALTGDEGAGRELADTLWAELYGVGRTRGSLESGQPRRSLLAYFHGRSTLATWLRSILAQRHVDTVREKRRTRSLDEDEPAGSDPSAVPPAGPRTGQGPGAETFDPDPDRTRYVAVVRRALRAAISDLEPGDRLRLAAYYVQALTLAQVGTIVGEHEATTSRKLTRARRRVRERVDQILRDEHGFTPAEIELCYQYVVEDPSVDVVQALEP